MEFILVSMAEKEGVLSSDFRDSLSFLEKSIIEDNLVDFRRKFRCCPINLDVVFDIVVYYKAVNIYIYLCNEYTEVESLVSKAYISALYHNDLSFLKKVIPYVDNKHLNFVRVSSYIKDESVRGSFLFAELCKYLLVFAKGDTEVAYLLRRCYNSGNVGILKNNGLCGL